jgi:hypothetical protein
LLRAQLEPSLAPPYGESIHELCLQSCGCKAVRADFGRT